MSTFFAAVRFIRRWGENGFEVVRKGGMLRQTEGCNVK